MAANGIFCLEGLWNNNLKRKISVQPLLNMLDKIGNVHYIYQDAATIEELEFYLKQWKQARYRNFPILYLAFHGESESLLIGKKKYTLDNLSDLLYNSCSHSIIMLASCNTLNTSRKSLERFLRKTDALALCGYRNQVDWITAAAFELLLLSSFQDFDFLHRNSNELQFQAISTENRFSDIDFMLITRNELQSDNTTNIKKYKKSLCGLKVVN
jgi:hypothetical protein